MAGLWRAAGGVDTRALLVNIALALVVAVALNAGIFAIAGDARASTHGGLLLGAIPGWFVGSVWAGLFVSLAAVKWRLQRVPSHPQAVRAAKWVVILLLFCGAYPIYTLGLSLPVVGLLGNVATIVLAAWVASLVTRVETAATLGPLAVIAWVAFASLAIVDEARWLW